MTAWIRTSLLRLCSTPFSRLMMPCGHWYDGPPLPDEAVAGHEQYSSAPSPRFSAEPSAAGVYANASKPSPEALALNRRETHKSAQGAVSPSLDAECRCGVKFVYSSRPTDDRSNATPSTSVFEAHMNVASRIAATSVSASDSAAWVTVPSVDTPSPTKPAAVVDHAPDEQRNNAPPSFLHAAFTIAMRGLGSRALIASSINAVVSPSSVMRLPSGCLSIPLQQCNWVVSCCRRRTLRSSLRQRGTPCLCGQN